MMRLKTSFLALLTVAAAGACGGDDSESPKDAAVSVEAGLDGSATQADLTPADEPFGRACSALGEICPDPDLVGYELRCLGLEGGTEGEGFCSRSCTDIGGECFGAPNGMLAACLIQGQAEQFCAFLCRSKELSWTCPIGMTCGQPNEDGVAICLP